MLSSLLGIVAHLGSPGDYVKDFDVLMSDLDQYGAYTREDSFDFKRITATYRGRVASATNRDQALAVFEDVMGELHDFHASLSTNNNSSPKLVPSGTDIIAEWQRGQAVVVQVRSGSPAEKLGVKYGDVITKIGPRPSKDSALSWLHGNRISDRALDWGLNSAIAGRWNQPREFTIKRGDQEIQVTVPTFRPSKSNNALTVNARNDGVVVLRPENSLGEDELVHAMDRAVPTMGKAKGVILDLRNTPSGGNSNVARGMMGLFISRRMPFQRHRVDERNTNTVRDWVEYATPRLKEPVRAKLVVLVGRWTSSMGEGIAIGFDAMHRGTVIGTKMAGLRGAVDSVELPSLGCRAFFPTEQVFHIDGTPRHEWVPPVLVKGDSEDSWMRAAIQTLSH